MKLPVQPKITEPAPGHLQIDIVDLAQFIKDSAALDAEWDRTMAGAEHDPEEIMRRMAKMFGEE